MCLLTGLKCASDSVSGQLYYSLCLLALRARDDVYTAVTSGLCFQLHLLNFVKFNRVSQLTPLSPFWWPLSRWTGVSRYQNVSILDFMGAKDDWGGGYNWSYKTCKDPVRWSPTPNFLQFLNFNLYECAMRSLWCWIYFTYIMCLFTPSVHWHCWLGCRKSIRTVNILL